MIFRLVRLPALIAMAVMIFTAFAAPQLRPVAKKADLASTIEFATLIPEQFAGWHVEKNIENIPPPPELQASLNKAYSQLIERTYIDDNGNKVMLTVAYSRSQWGDLKVHKPELCYPAQGFELLDSEQREIKLGTTTLPVTQLVARRAWRTEPITYWVLVGDRVAEAGIKRKLVQIYYGIKGSIPDGVLVRVSTIDLDTAHAFEVQDQFINALSSELNGEQRIHVFGVDRAALERKF